MNVVVTHVHAVVNAAVTAFHAVVVDVVRVSQMPWMPAMNDAPKPVIPTTIASHTPPSQPTKPPHTWVTQATTASQFMTRATRPAMTRPMPITIHVIGFASSAAAHAHAAVTAPHVDAVSATRPAMTIGPVAISSAPPMPARTGMMTPWLSVNHCPNPCRDDTMPSMPGMTVSDTKPITEVSIGRKMVPIFADTSSHWAAARCCLPSKVSDSRPKAP